MGEEWPGNGKVENSFWDKQTSGQTTSAGGTGKTTLQMQNPDTFIAAGWNVVDTWRICAGDTYYPLLVWQLPVGDFVCGIGVDWGDFGFFADRWLNSPCEAPDWCDGADLDNSGQVNWGDFSIFAGHWLELP